MGFRELILDLRELILDLRGLSFGPERTDFGPERADLGPERADLGPQKAWGDRRTYIRKYRGMSGNPPLCPTGHWLFGAAAQNG